MNEKWFNERYIKEVPIEEQIRGKVRAECHYMDKADIYEWIAQDEIKIMNLQSKIDKAIEYINNNLTISSILDGKKTYCLNDYSFNYEKLLDILKEDK